MVMDSNPTPDEEEAAALHAYQQADRAFHAAQDALTRATQDRADAMANLVRLHGTQGQVARLLGVHQSTISRTLRTRTTGTQEDMPRARAHDPLTAPATFTPEEET